MKKTLVSALTTALVVGAAGTVFAAANPFSDVPADHWAYDAVAQLAQDGVIDGYGDASFRGQQEITRYEMAQMIARAMAKNASGADQAMLDKLAAEFAEELNSLGVRVAALEKKVDNVKFTGRIRYRTGNTSTKKNGVKSNGTDKQELLFRFDPKATVNKNWFVQTRFNYATTAPECDGVPTFACDRLWAQGQYGNVTIKLGKINYVNQSTYGMVQNRPFTGAVVTVGKIAKTLNVDIYGARIDMETQSMLLPEKNSAAMGDVIGIDIYNNRKEKFTYGVGFMNVKFDKGELKDDATTDKANIIGGGLGYQFTKDLKLSGAYAKNTEGKAKSATRQRMHFELKYGNQSPAKAGSWAVWAKYMKMGRNAGAFSQQRLDNYALDDDFKGVELGGVVTLEKNIDAQIRYFTGKSVSDDAKKVRGVYTEVNFFF